MNLPAIDLSAARKPQPRVRMRDRVFRASELDALGKAPEATPEQLQTKLKKQQEHADKADDLFNEHDVQGTGALSREEFVACLVHLGVRDRFRDKFEKKVGSTCPAAVRKKPWMCGRVSYCLFFVRRVRWGHYLTKLHVRCCR